jgi:hypothetical protein
LLAISVTISALVIILYFFGYKVIIEYFLMNSGCKDNFFIVIKK